MSLVKSEDKTKWINSFVAICSGISTYIVIRFLGQMSEWFDLEAKISNFQYVTQGVGILFGLGIFLAVVKNAKAMGHMSEVYAELVKVIWPDRETVVKHTIGIIIGLVIISSIFVGVDSGFRWLLSLIY
jgi:preprotein translocase subunit SecE